MTTKKKWVKSVFSELSQNQTISTANTTVNTSVKSNAKRSLSNSDSPVVILDPPAKIRKIDCVDWSKTFAPQLADDLAVHAKKQGELSDWFKHCEVVRKKSPAQICLITGPTGCGKTSCVQVLAKVNGYELKEWTNPADCEVIHSLGDQPQGASYVASQTDAFKSFLLRSSRYKSVLVGAQSRRLLLVEDFPNALLRDASAFESILEAYSVHGKSPLIFVVADSKSRGLNISYNLFSDGIRQRFLINHISFNAIASTLMQKAMKRFCAIMRNQADDMYALPSQEVIDSILISAQGDIRNALLNLHFASLKGAPSMPTQTVAEESSKSKGNKKTRTKKNVTKALKDVGRDESITMMHALGRVFNPKLTAERKLVHSPEDIAENFSTEPKKFTDFVHANYVPHFRDIETIIEAIDGLSLADLILSEYREDALALIGLNVGIRSVMTANCEPVSGWMPVKGPKRINIDRYENAKRKFGLKATMSPKLYTSEYKSYAQKINPSAIQVVKEI